MNAHRTFFVFAQRNTFERQQMMKKCGWFTCHAMNTQHRAVPFCVTFIVVYRLFVNQLAAPINTNEYLMRMCRCIKKSRFHLESDLCLLYFIVHTHSIFRAEFLTLFYWPLNKLAGFGSLHFTEVAYVRCIEAKLWGGLFLLYLITYWIDKLNAMIGKCLQRNTNKTRILW